MADDQVNTDPLRNAPPLSDSEDEHPPVDRPVEPPTIPTGPPIYTPSRQEITLFYLQRFGFQTLLFLQFVWTLLSRAASTTQTLSLSVVRSLQTQEYVFFQGSSYPYRVQTTTLAGPGISPIEWYYNADTKVFLSSTVYNSTNEYQTHHLNWLAAEVKYNDLHLYDVSDYIQQVRWAGAERPSPALVMAAWSLHSGIVLREGLTLKTINEDGTESSLQLPA